MASNPTGRDGDAVLRLPLELAAAQATHGGLADTVGLQNVAIDDATGDGWITYDRVGATGGLMFVTDLETAATGSLGGGTRRIEGPATGLLTPKGVRLLESLDLVLVADTAARDMKAFALDASGDAAPLFVIDDLGDDNRAVWDFDYEPVRDTLYAAGTDGVVVVYDDFSFDSGQAGPSRTITPAVNGAAIGVNLHGIALAQPLLQTPVLVLTDVGDAAVATDGQLFTISDPASAMGITDVRGRISGPTSLLGNPVDLDLAGNDVYVAEKSNDRLLRFDAVTDLVGSVDVAASGSAVLTKAESVDVAGGLLISNITTVGNPAGRDADVVVRHDAMLAVAATLGTVGLLQSIQSAAVADDGTAFATLDMAGARGAILVVDGLATAADGTPLVGGTRRIEGPLTGLLAPKGLQLASLDDADVIFVADTGATARDIKVFAADATGDAAPLFVVENLGADRAPWDMDYDAATDRLYVACTDGVVAVFDDFATTSGAAGPDRIITPAVGGVDVSVNLHGIDYLTDSDLLVLSDVGDAAVITDGQLFVMAGAASASGLVDVQARVAGAATLLGNPVDLAVVNGAVYVAEKSNDRVLRYDDVATLAGEIGAAADQASTVIKPESVFVRFE